MRKLLISATAVLALVLAAPAFAGHNTYYKVKGGSATADISAATTLKSRYGIDVDRRLTLKLKRGGYVYNSNKALIADFTGGSKIKIAYDTRGPDGKKAGTTTVTITKLSVTVGSKSSFIVGMYKGQDMRVFNIGGGKMKKTSGKYAYKFSSKHITFNSQLTNLLNTFGTPVGNDRASAKVDLGGFSVKVK
ncbi:MAG: hypothetical protein QM648_00720 [Solirubrobacterales bacterium]